MRQLLTLLLSCGAVILLSEVPAPAAETLDTLADKQVQLAQLELARIKELVDLGALPRVRVKDAEAKLEDARDEAILAHDMYSAMDSALPDKGAIEKTSVEMTAAAQRRLDRQQARVDEARKMVDAGVAAKTYLAPFEAELSSRQTAMDLASLRARLMTDLEAKSQQQIAPAAEEPFIDDSGLALQGMEHYEGDGAFDETRQLPPLELAFSTKFDRPLPISAEGETEVHRALRFDHRGRVDVAVIPNAPEGVWLRQYLQLKKIPYYAFSRAIPGKATAAHIHIGPGSTRLAGELSTHASKHSTIRTHVAD